MKRKLLGSLLITLLAFNVTACSNNNKTNTDTDNQPTNEQQTTNEQNNMDQQNPQEESTPVLTSDMENIYNKLIDSKVLTIDASEPLPAKEYYVFETVKDKIEDGFITRALMNVKLQDVFVVKTTDTKAVEGALKEYLNSHEMISFGDGYGGEDNIESVRNAKIGTLNNYVYFIAAPNYQAIEDQLKTLLK